ncbi:general secretion pathway protein L [Marinobacter persicus]|uniref:Type II secretion system protein L n=1 Tax=Marinobacter persicus TaxID=930118 RepID=A0A1I3WC12_9GAMM|nr:type II secretion system protein GspL [Marinobacter persicus]GHD47266.1 hypothetical protein GCM10008110_14980 [Marinobacter persicus]SFK04769.1 general secretion pathway protein L [Marinobacter persicus]
MSYRLYVRPLSGIADNDEPRFSWVLQDASGAVRASGESDSRQAIERVLAQNALENAGLVGLVPAEETSFCLADIPARQSRLIVQALPYAVEEQVAQDVETLHLALGQHTGAGFQVCAIDRARMSHWQALFSGWHHAPLVSIYPDAALLPRPERGWIFCLDGSRVLMLSATGEWLALTIDNLPLFGHTLSEPTADSVATEVPVHLYAGEQARGRYGKAIEALSRLTECLRIMEKPLSTPVTDFLAWSCFQQQCQPIDLCQGKYSVSTSGANTLSRWKPLLAVVAVWFAVQVALEIGMGAYQLTQSRQLQEQAMAVYRDVFPDDTRTHAGNVRRVVQGQLRAMQNEAPGTGFLTLLHHTGDQLNRLPDSGSVIFNSINYSRNRGELVVDLTADSYEGMSRLRNGLGETGLQAEIGSVVNEAGGARGRLTVSGGQ